MVTKENSFWYVFNYKIITAVLLVSLTALLWFTSSQNGFSLQQEINHVLNRLATSISKHKCKDTLGYQ